MCAYICVCVCVLKGTNEKSYNITKGNVTIPKVRKVVTCLEDNPKFDVVVMSHYLNYLIT